MSYPAAISPHTAVAPNATPHEHRPHAHRPLEHARHPHGPAEDGHAPTPRHRRRYPCDFTAAQWEWLSRQLPEADLQRPGQRELLSAMHYRWTTGCSWRMIPHDFPPWQTVYGAFRRWQQRGELGLLRQAIWSIPRCSERSTRRGLHQQTRGAGGAALNPRENPHSPPQAMNR